MQDVHWIFDIKLISVESDSEEDIKIEMLKEVCKYATRSDLTKDAAGRSVILLGLVYSEKARRIVSSEATMPGEAMEK